jgi:hypothetical protein
MSDKSNEARTVLIQAVPAEGFNFHGEAHRLWPAGNPVKVTVLPGEGDGPEVPHRVERDGNTVVEMRPNPTVIGQRSFRALQKNPRIRILSDGASLAGAEVTSARQEVQEKAAEIMELKGQIAELEIERDAALAEVAHLRASWPTGKPPEAPALDTGTVTPVTDATPADKGKGKGKG